MQKQAIERLIAGGVSVVLASRGVAAIVTGHYASTSPLGPPATLDGTAAIWAGLAWIFLGAIVTLGLLIANPAYRRLGVMLICGATLAAGLCFTMAHMN